MKLTPKEKEICKLYGTKDKDGFVNCDNCPLGLDAYLDAPSCYVTIDKEQEAWIKFEYGVTLPRFGKGDQVAYIAGAVSSRLDTYQNEFANAEMFIKWLGFKVLSPAWLPVGLHDYTDYMNISKQMLLASDIVFFLDGWKESKGAKQEYEWAKLYGKRIAYYGKERVFI